MKTWYLKSKLHPLTLMLLPISWMFRLSVGIRRWCYRVGLIKQHHVNVPTVIVGNITLGGTGKTPFVIWLTQYLQSKGLHPGIISRGYGGKTKHKKPYWVDKNDNAACVGDEAILLARNTGCPLVLSTDKVWAAKALIQESNCDVLISDDGLQHYRLGRDIEIAMVDGLRGLGNHCVLPAGPLREAPSRLADVDYIIVNGAAEQAQINNDQLNVMMLKPIQWVCVKNSKITMPIDEFKHKHKVVHAVAGIGNPQRFFRSLRSIGFKVLEHPFPDHHLFKAEELHFKDDFPVVMTEKDAVKCGGIAKKNWWYLKVIAELSHQFCDDIFAAVNSRIDKDR